MGSLGEMEFLCKDDLCRAYLALFYFISFYIILFEWISLTCWKPCEHERRPWMVASCLASWRPCYPPYLEGLKVHEDANKYVKRKRRINSMVDQTSLVQLPQRKWIVMLLYTCLLDVGVNQTFSVRECEDLGFPFLHLFHSACNFWRLKRETECSLVVKYLELR